MCSYQKLKTEIYRRAHDIIRLYDNIDALPRKSIFDCDVVEDDWGDEEVVVRAGHPLRNGNPTEEYYVFPSKLFEVPEEQLKQAIDSFKKEEEKRIQETCRQQYIALRRFYEECPTQVKHALDSFPLP